MRALWTWEHTRQRLGGVPGGSLFAIPRRPPLRRAHVLARIAAWVQATQGGEAPKFTGKIFRCGGNQTLLASGAPLPILQARDGGRQPACRPYTVVRGVSAGRALLASQKMGRLFKIAKSAAASR